jgi:hypothetical protein
LSRRFGVRSRRLVAHVEECARALFARVPPPPAAPPAASLRWCLEGGVFVFMLAIASEIVNDNTSVPQSLRVRQPVWIKALIEYPRILQGWRMFAPEPPRHDSMIYVDATTAAGARVDPYNAVASDQPYPAGTVVPRHMGQTQFFVMYSDRIAHVGYAAYRQAFSEWLQAYPQRTGRPEDCLLRYDVYFVTDESPALGAGTRPKPLTRQRFMTYTAPPSGTCRPLERHHPSNATVSGL